MKPSRSGSAPRRRVWYISPEGFRELRRTCLLNVKACATLLGCSVSTVKAWDRGKYRVPWSAVKLLRLYRLGDLGALRPEWRGWTLNRNGLVSPEGIAYALGDLSWWSLTCRQAAAYRSGRRKSAAQPPNRTTMPTTSHRHARRTHMGKLANKVAIVTGGIGGIGRGIVKHFLDLGAKVVVVDIVEQAKGEAALAGMGAGDNGLYLAKDIAQPGNAAAIVKAAVERFGGLHVLVNNAHASQQAPIMQTTQAMWDLSLGTGTLATYHLMRAAYPELKKVHGSIVNFASGAGLRGQENQVTYAAAKEAIRAITRVAANEWARDGIRVNLVSPIALTPGIEAWSKQFPDQYQQMLDGIPLHRLGDPEHDIAPIVAFLASEESRYMTGQTLMADGGSIMLR